MALKKVQARVRKQASNQNVATTLRGMWPCCTKALQNGASASSRPWSTEPNRSWYVDGVAQLLVNIRRIIRGIAG
jgi:hypothetical protein